VQILMAMAIGSKARMVAFLLASLWPDTQELFTPPTSKGIATSNSEPEAILLSR